MDDSNGPAAAPQAEDSATQAVPSLCLFCGAVMEPARTKNRTPKMFCSDNHRVAHREARMRQAIQVAADAVAEVTAEMIRFGAEAERAAAVLTRASRELARWKHYQPREKK